MSAAVIRRQVMRGVSSTARATAARTAPVFAKHVSVRAFSATCAPKFIAVRSLVNQAVRQDSRFYSSYPAHNVIAMPALSPTMTAGAIGTWQKKVGDEIQPGDVLVEIETDKAQMDFECQEEGFLAKVLVDTGAKDVNVGKPIAILVEDKEDVAAFENFSMADIASDAPKAEATPEAPKEEKKEAVKAEAKKPENETASKKEVKGDKAPQKAAGPSISAQIPAAYTPQNAAGDAFTDIPTTSMRKIIASRLTESKQQVPHYYVTVEVDMDKTTKLREVLNKSAEGKYKLSVNDFIIKASALALKKVPEVNSAWQGDFIRQYNSADICVAVATPSGLITPIVTSAEAKGLTTISTQVKDLAKRARDGKLAPHEYQGGSFTISNLGMFGINNFTAIINPPQSCILAIGGTQQKVVSDETTESGLAVRNVMEVTLSADHRVVDGAVGAAWLQAFREYMENPLKMML
ncbi:hypothetical protein G6F55_001440 [Rhizopus delemar]|uniref:Dihydrolipoamide acetyltransferase component of pyruvate dehydrogenase complex n=3 Tax=Rhizopus TaxID=4842 RepID=I1C1P4_RHIO9|nr:pyruvate dehydrogenase complex dihydrolipoamide acetyltransferase [Rhizopus delemar RA 99-880]KAG1046077.1 hypothetical protein G6F43_011171 [Rhizopus delemar]KAG1546785.1 hypothetical protein G6F51_004662 [Rhizopus arrhizus]KAG1464958.1 hypothetical protein G6F55_001440 [Rhizopus delemar]KAG1500294.1 hypothetical protein G6F54_003819 [Rhizopus delemar]|eukprot:EIE82374.1 pyruvate dehydrogenase complex dihydrolipoamide acetyltransferase [Rhizopus delemar RA 99-880]